MTELAALFAGNELPIEEVTVTSPTRQTLAELFWNVTWRQGILEAKPAPVVTLVLVPAAIVTWKVWTAIFAPFDTFDVQDLCNILDILKCLIDLANLL